MSDTRVIVPAYNLEGRRAENADAVLRHLHAGGLEVLTVAPLNGGSMSHARNLGAEIAEHENPAPSVLVFNDADSLVPHRQILEAAMMARMGGGLVYAYTLYLSCRPSSSARYIDGELELEHLAAGAEELMGTASVGCVAITAEAFRRVGRFDQRFYGWGYEDYEFRARCAATLGGNVGRVAGPLYHLWHGARRPDHSPIDADPASIERNRLLWAELSTP